MRQQIFVLLFLFILNFIKALDDLSDGCDNLRCTHGKCQKGICNCLSCYTGPSCDLLENKSPIFQKSSYKIANARKPSIDEVFGQVVADDEDSQKCESPNCPCNTIEYSIIDDKNYGIFSVNSKTGELKLMKNDIYMDYDYSIVVKATNKSPFDNIYDTTTVFVNFGNSDDNTNERLGRFRRATAPTVLAFTLVQIFPTTNISVATIGQKLTFQLTITFPVGSNNLTVELFAPEAKNPVMMLCNAYVSSVGSQVSTPAIPAPTVQGLNGAAWPVTRMTYVITNQVNNQASPANIADIQIAITFDAYMLYYNDTPNATLYYVSAGAEYLNSTQIWVGQAGYTSSVVVPTPSPNVTITGDTAIYPGSTAAFDIVIYSPDHYLLLNMELYSPFNDTTLLSFCAVTRYSVGASWFCLPTNFSLPVLTNITSNMVTYYTMATMNVGYLTNLLRLNSSAIGQAKDTIIIKMTLRTNPLAWVGGTTYIGASISTTATNIVSIKQSLPILIKPVKALYLTPIPATISYYSGVSTAAIGAISQLLLNITIPQSSELDYTITASFQNNSTEICGFQIVSFGSNIPCLNQVILSPIFTSSSDNYQIMANVTIPNVRHVLVSSNPVDDVLSIIISFRPINDVRNNAGSTITSNVLIAWNGGVSPLQTNTYTLQTAVPSMNITSSNVPTFTFQMVGNDGNISVSQMRTIKFSMVLSPGIIYQPVTLAFFMPFNTTARMKICQATISFIGSFVQCFEKNVLTGKFVYSSKLNDTSNYDTLTIPIGTLGSQGPIGRVPTQNDRIDILIDFLVSSHSMNLVNYQTSINAGMMLSATQIWVGTQNINFVTAPTLAALVAPNIPTLTGSRTDSVSNIVWQNDLAILQYIIKVAGGSTASLTFAISSDITATDNFGVCSITVVQKGNSIPCIQTTITNTTWTTLSKYYKTVSVEFSTIINSGTAPIANPSFDENSILLQVIVKFGVNTPASFNVIATLTYNTGTVVLPIPFTLQTTLSRINGTIAANQPIFTFVLIPLFNNNATNVSMMGYGEAMRAAVTVQLQPNIIQTLTLAFSSTAYSMNQMDINSVNILSVGRNIPCLQTGMMTFTSTSRSQSTTLDMVSLNLGTVCRSDIIGVTTAADNTIVIEAVFRVRRIPVNSPTTLDVNSIALVNNDQIFITKITINIVPSSSHIIEKNFLNQTITMNATLSTSALSINQNVTLSASVGIPPYTQFASGAIRVYPIWPSGADSALIVTDNTNFTSTFGSNLLFNSQENLAMSSTSTMNTTQNDNIFANVGICQNVGTNYRMGQANYTGITANDFLTIQFTIRLTDNIVAANAATFSIIIGAEFGSQRVNVSIPITVSRSNTETIAINATTVLISNNTHYTQSDAVTISASANLLNGSKLECRNFSIYVALPPFMSLTAILNMSYTSPGFSIQQSSLSLGGVAFTVPHFFVNEQIMVVFSVKLNASTTLSQQRQTSLAVIPIIYSCKTLNWPVNPLGNKIINNASDVRVQIQGQPIVIAGCNDDLKVTDNTIVKDCAISAYMSPYADNGPLKIRSNSASMWKPPTRGGYYNKFRYIDIVLGSVVTIRKVRITSTIANKPQQISIYGTMDGLTYSFYSTAVLLYTLNVADVTLSNPIFNFLGIRVSVTQTLSNDSDTGLNIDLFGCTNPNVSVTINPCPISYTKPVTTITDFYYRGYLYIAPHLFVCDDVPLKSAYLETYPRCFRVNDASTTIWQDMGPYIGKVIGYDITTKSIYGIASDLKSFIMSTDDGVTWISINENGWKISKSTANLLSVTQIPWTIDTGFNSSSVGLSCTKFVAGPWNFCYDGVYNGATKLLSWNTCCAL